MSLIEILLLAVALGIDCFLVSFAQGLILSKNKFRNSLLLALTMGIFQGGMPLLSYYPTGFISESLAKYSDWIVFIIFMILGVKFIVEAFNEKEENVCCSIGIKCLLSMGIATSIDALGAGVGLKLTGVNILLAVVLIGIVSFIMSIIGFWIGNIDCKIPSKYLEIFGGIILVGLAFKALL